MSIGKKVITIPDAWMRMGQRPNARIPTIFLALMMVLSAGALGALGEGSSTDDGETRSIDGYRTLQEVEDQLRSLAENYSDIAVLYDLGELYPNGDGSTKTSWDGHHFWAIKVSDNPTIEEPDEPNLLYVGMHHAREWMSVEMMMYLLEHILPGYSTNQTIRDYVDTREMWFFPMLNPDGFAYTQEDPSQRMWRKNRRDNGDGEWGVDPNRNYAYAWAYDNMGSSGQTNDPLYRGPAPFSEPCTQIMRDLALDIVFVGAISFHTYSELIIFPWAYRDEHALHYRLMKELGKRMATFNGYEYGDTKDGTLYNSNGAWDDWMYNATGTLSFTFELNTVAQNHNPPASAIQPTCSMNYEAALVLAEFADDYYAMFDGGIEGTVQDPRGNPIEGASVHVALLGDDSLDFVTGPDGKFSFHAPYDLFYTIRVEYDGYSSALDNIQVLWRDRYTRVNLTIHDNVAPVIAQVQATHDGEVGTTFGIGEEVRIDLWEAQNETGLQGEVTIQNVAVQYFHRRKPLIWDATKGSYHYVWNTSDLKPASDYLVSTELWDIDGNRDKDGVVIGMPDLRLDLRDITPPMAPIGLEVSAPPEGGTLNLVWGANMDDTQLYTLERRVGTAGEWTFLINLTKEDIDFADGGLTNDVSYFYRIMAWDAVPLPSLWSDIVEGVPMDTIPPGEVTGLSVNAPVEGGRLVLSWTGNTDDSAQYVLERDDGPGFTELAVLARGENGYVDSGLENGKVYFYRICAIDASGNRGSDCVPVLGMPQDLTPPKPPVVQPLPALTNLSEHPVKGTAEPNASVVVVIGGEVRATIPVGENGTFEGTVTLANGINRVRFRTIDPALNPSGLTAEAIVQVDVNPPRVTSSQPFPDQTGVLVTETVLVAISEALVRESLEARLLYAETGVEVPSAFQYDTVSKTISLYSTTKLEKDTTYRIVVDGTDTAGNHLEGGSFDFMTEHEEVQESEIGYGLIVAIILAVIIVVAMVFVLRHQGRTGHIDRGGAPDGAGNEEGPVDEEEEAEAVRKGWEEY